MSFSFGGLNNSLGGAERKTGTLFGSTTAPAGGLFGQQQQQQQPAPTQQPTSSLFGSTAAPQQQQQQQNTGSSLFGQVPSNQGSTLFGASQQQQQQQSQSQNPANSIFGGRLYPAPQLPQHQAQQLHQSQNGLPQLRQSTNSPFASTLVQGQRERSVIDEMMYVNNQWEPSNPNCAFQYYFYNSVPENDASFYGPQPHEDQRKWEEALNKKPTPNSIPILLKGFEDMAGRIQAQALAVGALQTRLHEINTALKLMKDDHELKFASRIAEAKRRHIVFTQRTLALATKVQILRNRGYAMDQPEEELKKKLVELEKKMFDPVLGGRQEEIWARMSSLRGRVRILQEEIERQGKAVESQQNGEVLSEADQKQLDKILKDYDKQLEHLKKGVQDMALEYAEWEQEKKPASGR